MTSELGRDWRLLWTASSISTLGDGAFLAALPLLAVTVTQDPRLIAGVTVAGTLPWLLTMLPAGALADRSDGRRMMRTAQLVQAAAVALLAAFQGGHIALIYAVAFILGVAETAAKAGAQKLIPAVVPGHLLETANGRQQATQSVVQQFIGPPLGGLLFVLALPLPFWVDAVTFALSAFLVSRIRLTPRVPSPRRALRTEIADGLRWLNRHRLLRAICVQSGVANLCFAMTSATLVLFARERVGLGEIGYGVLLATMAFGGVAGGLLSGRLIRRIGGRTAVTATIIATPLAWLAIGLFGRDLVTIAVFATVTSFSASVWNVATGSLRQREVPPELLGRVTSAHLVVAWGMQPIGALVGGLVAAGFGLSAPWLVAGGVRLVAALFTLPRLRNRAGWPVRRPVRTR